VERAQQTLKRLEAGHQLRRAAEPRGGRLDQIAEALRRDPDPVRLPLVVDGSHPGEAGLEPGQRAEDEAAERRTRRRACASAGMPGVGAVAGEPGPQPRHGRREMAVEPLLEHPVRESPPALQAIHQPARTRALGAGHLRRSGAHPVAVHLKVSARARRAGQDPEPPPEAPRCGLGQVPAPGAEPAPQPAQRHPEVVQRLRVAGAAEPESGARHLVQQGPRDEPGRAVRRLPEQVRRRLHGDLARWLVVIG